MRHTIIFAAAVVALATATPGHAQDMSAEKQAVIATVQKMWDGMRTRDTTLLKSLFADDVRLLRVGRNRQTGEEVVQMTPIAGFIRSVGNSTGPALIERMFDPIVQISGNAAQLWTEYDFHLGSEFSHCGIDAFTLLKVKGEWKIVSVADTSQRESCPKREPPK